MDPQEFRTHQDTFRHFVQGVSLFILQAFIVLVLLAYFFM
jgi:hypothetical protein